MLDAGVVRVADAAGPNDCPKRYEESFTSIEGHGIGIAVCKPSWSPDALRVLRPLERNLKDYWDVTWEFDGDLLFFDIVESAVLVQPERVYVQNSVNQHPRTIFFRDNSGKRKTLLGRSHLAGRSGPRIFCTNVA